MRTTDLEKMFVLVLASFIAMPLIAQECKENFEKAEICRKKGHYKKAIDYYTKSRDCGNASFRNKSAAMISDLEDIIRQKDAVKVTKSKQQYIIVPSLIYLPSGTEEQTITVESSGQWNAKGRSDIIKVTKTNAKTLTLSSVSQNTSTKPRKSSIIVECGEVTRIITVEQDGVPEILEYKSKYMNVPFVGGRFVIDLNTNTKWKVDYADWYKVIPDENDSTRMVVLVDKNTKNEDRNGTIIVRSESGASYDEMEIHQYANESKIFSPVDSIILIHAKGDTIYVPIISDNPNWTESDRPSWCMAKKLNSTSDTLMIIISKNENYISREGFVNIKSNDRVAGICIRQEGSDILKPKPMVGGRNISFGLTAGYVMPFINTTAGGDYVGSIHDYSLGNSNENASYKSASGFSVGIFSDMRLYKNIFLIVGINYTNIKYQNDFGLNTEYTIPYNSYEFLRGEVQNSYKEEYSHNMLEIPILASFRFPFSDISHLQLNIGPVLNFGLSSRLSFSGNTDSETMHLYNRFTNQRANNSNYIHHTSSSADFNLYQPCVLWTESYTTGNITDIYHHNTFTDAPLKRFNYGLKAGVVYEYAGLSFGMYYTLMLSNMANSTYWENKRWTVLNESNSTMPGYKQRIHTLEFKLAYTVRYFGLNSNK